jgi:hypothetical protein
MIRHSFSTPIPQIRLAEPRRIAKPGTATVGMLRPVQVCSGTMCVPSLRGWSW